MGNLRAQGARPQARVEEEPPNARVSGRHSRRSTCTFHDLRHEAGSRLLEAGWPLHNVAHMLGHANIAQTSTYLNATKVGLQDAMRRLDASRCNPVASKRRNDRAPLRNEGGRSDRNAW